MKFEKYIDELLSRNVFPGITVLAGTIGTQAFHGCYGNKSVVPEKVKLQPETIYDVASLTKPLITALLIIKLIDSGELKEESKVKHFFGYGDEISVLHLVTHTSGLPAWFPLYLSEKDHIKTILELKRVAKPGKRIVYSCLGYILLSEIIKKISGKTIAELAKSEIIDKLKLKNTFFKVPKGKLAKCAPTEFGNRYEKATVKREFPDLDVEEYKWRDHLLQGEVNDNNAMFLNGSSGNSGLFSTVEDIFRLSREFYPEFTELVKPESAIKFWKNHTPFGRSHRTFGFKLNSSLVTSGGRSVSRKAIGHSGFTGTSIWMEPDPANIFILFTNRIHPVVDGKLNFNKIRRRLHKLLKKDIGMV